MKHPARVEDYLDHIAQAIQRATEYIEDVGSLAAFQQRPRDQDAVIRNIEIIGEAASQIQRQSPEFVTAHPQLPWLDMRDMRNRVIHNYFDVNLSIVWSTVKEDFPRLKQQIDDLLRQQQPTLADRFGAPPAREAEPGPEQDHQRNDDPEPEPD